MSGRIRTGSGCSTLTSAYTSAAWWQRNVTNWAYTGCGSQRSIADVAAVADPSTGFWVYSSAPNEHGGTGWAIIGGTSLSAPVMTGVFALGGHAAKYTWPSQSLYEHLNQFHDVTSGSNGTCTWTIACTGWTGYDGPTGVGTPWGIGGFDPDPRTQRRGSPPLGRAAFAVQWRWILASQAARGIDLVATARHARPATRA